MHSESRYHHRRAGYRYPGEDEQYRYGGARPRAPGSTASLPTGLPLAVMTVHLAGPWTAVPGLGR